MKIIYGPEDMEDPGRSIDLPATFGKHLIPKLEPLCSTYRFGEVLRQEFDGPAVRLHFLFIHRTAGGHIYLKWDHPAVLLQYPIKSDPLHEGPLPAGKLPCSHLRVIRADALPLITSQGMSGHLFIELQEEFRHEVREAFPEIIESIWDSQMDYHSPDIPLNYVVAEIIRKLGPGESYATDPIMAPDFTAMLLREFHKGYMRTETIYHTRPNPEKEKVLAIRDEILYAPNLRFHTLKILSGKYDIPPGILWRRFRYLLQSTLTAYIRTAVMAKALLLVQTTQIPIPLIAFTLGYSDSKNFSRAFAQYHRLSPHQLRAFG
jgi:AraC-like DNA-binding protein